MGSFNVACSISNVSIGCGEKVAFIPLCINKYMQKQDRLPVPEHMLIYPHALLNPFCLPIFGEYDDYGSIENIKEDANTKAIEEYIGMSIKAFLNCCGCNRAPDNNFSNIFNYFASEEVKEAVSSYKIMFGGKFLETIGFKRLNIAGEAWYDYKHKDFPYLIKLIAGYDMQIGQPWGHRILGIGFEMYNSDGEIVHTCSHYDPQGDLPKMYHQFTGYHIYIDKKYQSKISLLKNMSGMFVHGDIWDYMCKIAGEHTYDGTTHAEEFEKLRQRLFDYANGKPQYIEVTAGTVEEQRKHHNLMCKLLVSKRDEKFVALEPGTKSKVKRHSREDPLSTFSGKGHFRRFYDNWAYFEALYRDGIQDGGLKESFVKYFNFYWEMYSSNRFFFPGMNGEQCGNTRVSLRLAKATVKLLEERQKEYDKE